MHVVLYVTDDIYLVYSSMASNLLNHIQLRTQGIFDRGFSIRTSPTRTTPTRTTPTYDNSHIGHLPPIRNKCQNNRVIVPLISACFNVPFRILDRHS